MRRRSIQIFLIAVVGALPVLWWKLAPAHIVLDIPVAKHLGGGDFWWETQESELSYADEAGVILVRRQVGTAYPNAQGWNTVDEAMAYFSQWLAKTGWDAPASGADRPIVPESRLLPDTQARCFHHSDDRGPRRDEACIAIWPIASDTVVGFHVVLTTARSSFWQKLGAD
jgi:hypothetical protein